MKFKEKNLVPPRTMTTCLTDLLVTPDEYRPICWIPWPPEDQDWIDEITVEDEKEKKLSKSLCYLTSFVKLFGTG